MSKNKIITTLIACAVICSALAGFLIYRFLSPQRGTIFVFNGSYDVGEQITADMLTPMQVDVNMTIAGRNDKVDSTFVTPEKYADVVRSGDSLRMAVSEGMPLTTAMLSVQGGSTVEMNMRTDAIAITVPVDRFAGVTNDLKEGAKVNVYSTQDNVTVLIQQNKRVLEVFKEEGAIVGVSLEEDIQESMELVSAMAAGRVYLGLVDATGYQASEGDDPYYVADTTKYLVNGNEYADLYSYFENGGQIPGTESETEVMTAAGSPAATTDSETEPETETLKKEDGADAVFVPGSN